MDLNAEDGISKMLTQVLMANCVFVVIQLSDMVVTYQQLPEGEQPAAFHLLQASLGPLLAVPADYVLIEAQSGQQLIITDPQHISEAEHETLQAHNHQITASAQQQQTGTDGQSQKTAEGHDFEHESDDMAVDSENLTLEEGHEPEKETSHTGREDPAAKADDSER